MVLARFLIYLGLFVFCRWPNTNLRLAKSWLELWVTQHCDAHSLQLLMYRKYYGYCFFFIMYKIYFLLALLQRQPWYTRIVLTLQAFFSPEAAVTKWFTFLWVFLVGLGSWIEFLGCFIEKSSEIWRKIKCCLSLHCLYQYLGKIHDCFNISLNLGMCDSHDYFLNFKSKRKVFSEWLLWNMTDFSLKWSDIT